VAEKREPGLHQRLPKHGWEQKENNNNNNNSILEEELKVQNGSLTCQHKNKYQTATRRKQATRKQNEQHKDDR
jgi:hypothetical protein